jgi:hypothetical protein
MRRTLAAPVLSLLLAAPAPVQGQPPADPRAWVETSNRHAQLLLDVVARFAPESAAHLGVSGLDEEVSRLTADTQFRARLATQAALAQLEGLLKSEPHPQVRQDLAILVTSARRSVRGYELNEERLLPYVDVTGLVFGGVRSLLDAQVAESRRPAAIVRVRKYAGLVDGYEPITAQAIRRIRERLGDPKYLPPSRSEVERDLANSPILVQGIEKLFDSQRLDGWREPFEVLKKQLAEYDQFVRSELLPKARTDFRLPPDLYAFALERVGVAMDPPALAKMARGPSPRFRPRCSGSRRRSLARRGSAARITVT